MNVPLSDDLRAYVRRKVETGQFPSEAAVVEMALRLLRVEDNDPACPPPAADGSLDPFAGRIEDQTDDGDVPTMEEVLEMTSVIKDSMSRVIIEEERAERF